MVFAQLSQSLFRLYRIIIICILYQVFFTVEAWIKTTQAKHIC